MNEQITQLQREVEDLKAFVESLKSSFSIPLEVDQAIRERFSRSNSGLLTLVVADGGTGAASLSGILKGNGTSAFTVITPLNLGGASTVYYVADSSGGAVTRKLTFSNGILISET